MTELTDSCLCRSISSVDIFSNYSLLAAPFPLWREENS